jgi:glucose/arabinose dehydrogenase
LRAAIHALVLFILCVAPSHAGATQNGFSITTQVTGLQRPTAMAFAPDGRLFVCQQDGQVRVVKNGVLLAQPFLTVAVDGSGERGLLGVTFDPQFSTNGWIYVYYTTRLPAIHNRVSRFTASGDVAVAGSEVMILELENLTSATNHNGGAIHFGEDGKLYVGVGENANGANAQTLANRLGKILRINADGSIPTDNPFHGTASGPNRAIWALGLRNPFTFAFQPGTQRMLINDVGASTWEEINDGFAGANYGWPATEGPTTNPSFRSPIFAYGHGTGGSVGCAMSGGLFYNPATIALPPEYIGNYFFADLCSGWIRRLVPASGNTVTDFATGFSQPVDLDLASDGSVFVLARGGGTVRRIAYVAPLITAQPSHQFVSPGQSVTFRVSASGQPPLSYQWQRNGAPIAGATAASYTIGSAGSADDGAQFRVIVSNAFGNATSLPATLRVFTPVADRDADGIPDSVEGQEGTNPDVRDNLIFSNARLFVRQQYGDLLNREGDSAGISAWAGRIESRMLTRAQVAHAFVQSNEFQRGTLPATRLFLAFFLNYPNQGELLWLRDRFHAGVSLNALAAEFAASSTFQSLYGGLSNETFVGRVYRNVLGRQPDAQGFNAWVARLNGGMSRADVLVGFSESAEYARRSFAWVHVAHLYGNLLRRSADPGGFRAWVGFLEGGNALLAAVQRFLDSPEYRARFQP